MNFNYNDPSLSYNIDMSVSSVREQDKSINLYFLTLSQLMDYYDCYEKANYKRAVFLKLFSKVMREKYQCDIYGGKLSEGQINRKTRKYSKRKYEEDR